MFETVPSPPLHREVRPSGIYRRNLAGRASFGTEQLPAGLVAVVGHKQGE
jgi:hypothetical protein